jgi:hypothetical protein
MQSARLSENSQFTLLEVVQLVGRRRSPDRHIPASSSWACKTIAGSFSEKRMNAKMASDQAARTFDSNKVAMTVGDAARNRGKKQ